MIPHNLSMIVLQDKISIDIETSGLNPITNDLSIITIKQKEKILFFRPFDIIKMDELRKICQDRNIIKIFHHAAFDISFLINYNINFSSVWCTKVAEKIIHKNSKYSLKDLIQKYINISIDKKLQCSNWNSQLSEQQINYIKNDVLYLEEIMLLQYQILFNSNMLDLALKAMSIIPFIGELRSKGFNSDIFKH